MAQCCSDGKQNNERRSYHQKPSVIFIHEPSSDDEIAVLLRPVPNACYLTRTAPRFETTRLSKPIIPGTLAYEAVLFDLLSALVDSWALWDELAGDTDLGRCWRMRYLANTYGAGEYRPYLSFVAESAVTSGLPESKAIEMKERWAQLEPWPEAPRIVSDLASKLTVGVVTNCSEELGQRAARQVSTRFEVVVTAERAGYYKPHPRIYGQALAELGVAADRVLFVAGSPLDVRGASAIGMPVYWHNRVGLKDEEAESLAVDVGADLHDLQKLVP